MSKNLARILGKTEDELRKKISALEEKCGYPSEDVRLLAENKQRLRAKTAQLGLDPDDTSDEELYHALRARFERDSDMLDKALAVNEHSKFDERLAKAAQLVSHCTRADDMWVIKNSVAKSALAKNPPKQVAKRLNYRSAASMIKREDAAEVFLAATVVESATWQKNITKLTGKLSHSQFELRPIRIINLKPERWGGVEISNSPVVSDKHIGALAVWPSDDLADASLLCLMLLLLEGIRSLNPDGYGEALDELNPALRWWADAGHLISDGDQPVSLNIRDVSLNHLRNNELQEAVRHHSARSLWGELTARYQKISESLAEKVPNIQYDFGQREPAKLPTSAELAEEFATKE